MSDKPIKLWPADERPREKLYTHGPRTLSDSELLAILISTGTREFSAIELARKVLGLSGNSLTDLGKLSVKELQAVKGIGEAKAITIAAALEIGRRRASSELTVKPKITTSQQASALFMNLLTDLPHEEFWVAYLTRSNNLIEKFQVSSGGISGTVTDVKIIMKRGIENLASSVIICHNHPSGNAEPSEQDKQITKKIAEAARFVDISLLDHIIIAGQKYLSFADEGLLN